MADWYAVGTHSRKEAFAERHLRGMGFDTILPHLSCWKPRDDRKLDLVKIALLPGYLFVELDEQHPPFWAVNECPGVRSIVYRPGGVPWPIPSKAMELITAKLDPSGLYMGKPPKIPGFDGEIGDYVSPKEGTPYFGFWYCIKSIDPDGRIGIELNTFGRMVPTRLKAKDVGQLISKANMSEIKRAG
jgi:transcription antitermination factor NusG